MCVCFPHRSEARTAVSCMGFSMVMMAAGWPVLPPSVWQLSSYWDRSTPATQTTTFVGSSHRSVLILFCSFFAFKWQNMNSLFQLCPICLKLDYYMVRWQLLLFISSFLSHYCLIHIRVLVCCRPLMWWRRVILKPSMMLWPKKQTCPVTTYRKMRYTHAEMLYYWAEN